MLANTAVIPSSVVGASRSGASQVSSTALAHHGDRELLLAGEVMIERAARHPGSVEDVVRAGRGIALSLEQRRRGVEHALAKSLRIVRARPARSDAPGRVGFRHGDGAPPT
jgi:plasmid stability protein